MLLGILGLGTLIVAFTSDFSTPLSQMCLLADVIQLFKDAGTRFDPSYVMRDVREAVSQLHISGQLHSYMVSNPDLCFERVEGLGDLLLELKRKGRMVFLLTNSPFHFVDQGVFSDITYFNPFQSNCLPHSHSLTLTHSSTSGLGLSLCYPPLRTARDALYTRRLP